MSQEFPLEKLNTELNAVTQLVAAVTSVAEQANTNASTALARSENMLVGADTSKKNQSINLSTLLGISDDDSIKSRSITFFVGAKGFLGYANDADGSTYTDKEVTEDPSGLAQYEVVNYRTLIKKIRDITENLPNTYLKREGDAAGDSAVHTFSTVIFRGDGRKVHYKTTSADAEDPVHEIVNVATLTSTLKAALVSYVPNDGGSYIKLSVETAPENPTDVVRLADLQDFLTNAGGTVKSLKVTDSPKDSTDVVRKSDLDSFVPAPSYPPVWTSGKFVFGVDTTTPDALSAVSVYTIYNVNIANQPNGAYYAKLLSCKNSVAIDGKDSNFLNSTSIMQRSQIPGHSLPGTEARLPYPVDYTLYLECDIDSSEMGSMFDLVSGTRMRIPIASSLSDQHANLIYSLGIDKDGDLAILFRSNGLINVPWRNEPISLNGLEKNKPRLYVNVNSWSYYPTNLRYLNTNTAKAGACLINHTFARKQNDLAVGAGTVRRSFRLYAVDILNPSWQVNGATCASATVRTDLNTGLWYCEFDFYNTSGSDETESILLTLTGKNLDNTPYSSGMITVTVILGSTPVASDGLTILNNDMVISTKEVNAPYLVSFNPMASGGTKPYTFSITPGSTNPLTNINYNADLNLVTGYQDGLNSSESITINVLDGHGISVSKTINISVNPSSASFNCFGKDTYVRTVNGGIKFKYITTSDILLTPSDIDHSIGSYSLRESKISGIKIVENEPTVKFNDIHVKSNHRFASSNCTWRQLSQLSSDDSVIACRDDSFEEFQFNGLQESSYTGKLYNLESEHNTYMVSSCEFGPWFLVHNEKIGL